MPAGALDSPIETQAGSVWAALLTGDAAALPRSLQLARAAAPFLLVAVVAFFSRLRYSLWAYHDTFASGDGHLILAKAMFISRGQWRPPGGVGAPAAIFSDPPFIALLLGTVSRVTGLPLAIAPFVITPIVTIAAVCALYAVARRAFDPTVALIGAVLVSLLPRFSLDSTEPDKVGYVVSFFIIALFFLYEAQARPRLYLIGGAFMGLCVFSHTTGYIFLGVYGLSHVAITRGNERRLLDRWFVAGMVIPLLAIGLYVQLNDHFQRAEVASTTVENVAPATAPTTPTTQPAPEAPAPAVPSGSNEHRFVPGSIQLYYDNITGIAKRGFKDSAWNLYFDSVRKQVTTPAYILAIAGFGVAAGVFVARRRYAMLPLMLWMMLVTLAFAIQHPALSHRTRYPSYVTPVFALFAAYFVVTAARFVASRAEASNRAWYAAAAMAPVIAFLIVLYVRADASGQRKLYAPHERLASYLAQTQLVGADHQLLYMAWPSTTFFLLDPHPEYEPYLNAYGWGLTPLFIYSRDYVAAQRISYFAYDHTGSDYVGSSDLLMAQLKTQFTLKRIQTFCGTDPPAQRDPKLCGESYAVLYELAPPQQ